MLLRDHSKANMACGMLIHVMQRLVYFPSLVGCVNLECC